jgi:non-ribosomal peptide synthetase component E (peptide arylation enzyme)
VTARDRLSPASAPVIERMRVGTQVVRYVPTVMDIARMLTWTADRYPGARDGSGLAAIKRPKRYVAVHRIPTSEVGKILRRALTEGRYQPLAEVQT